jgi:hypothetical protein
MSMLNEVMIYGVLILLYVLLMYKAGKGYPILYLFGFVYYTQYIFSTYLIYNNYEQLSEKMPLEQGEYFAYAIPALCCLFLGVFLFNKDRYRIEEYLKRVDREEAGRLGYFLLVISYGFDALPYLGINALDSVVSFTTYLKYVATFCFVFSNNKFNYILVALIYLQLAILVLASGVFISFFIWSTFFFFFLSLRLQLPFLVRICFILVAIPVLILVQSVKHDYRKQTWKGDREAGLELFSELVQKNQQQDDGPFEESEGVVRTVGRLSQGWHLSLTLDHVPRWEPFANGAELTDDVVASIVPRVLFSDKKKVNSQEKFERYTGHKLRGSTSMSIGVLGDFFINFGRTGSFIMLFVFGAVIAWAMRVFVRRYVITDPINIIWIPFILSYLIRANNDFYIFFNGMVKGFVIFLIVNYVRYHYLGAKRRMKA